MFSTSALSWGTGPTATICNSAKGSRRWMLPIVVAAACWMVVAVPAVAQLYQGVDLYTLTVPDGFNYPSEYGVLKADGGQVVGYPTSSSTGYRHALLWNSSGAVVDLHPTSLGDISESVGLFTNGVQQVGAGKPASGNDNALLWNGS